MQSKVEPLLRSWLMQQLETDQLACTESIKKGSLSFSMASMLLSLKHRSAIHCLYSWCRWCDNTIDDIPQSAPAETKLAAIAALRRETDLALLGNYAGDHFVFRSLQNINATYHIPKKYFHDLIDGMEMDVSKHRYESLEELQLYCYRVAGVVGLMFSHIVGLRDTAAMDNAVALGSAMQLTNIARDVREDFNMGRIYLPSEWLKNANVDASQLTAAPEAVWPVVERLLTEAARYYKIGDQGMRSLPWKAALAAMAARNIYSEIGNKILRSGPEYLKTRTIVSGPRKCVLLFKSFILLLAQTPYRILHPFKSSASTNEWSYK